MMMMVLSLMIEIRETDEYCDADGDLVSVLMTGISEEELVRKEMSSLLCMTDRHYSQLSELMPERSGMSGMSKELFEPTLSKVIFVTSLHVGM